MDKGKHPNVVRTWMAGKARKPLAVAKAATKAAPLTPHKPEPRNKT